MTQSSCKILATFCSTTSAAVQNDAKSSTSKFTRLKDRSVVSLRRCGDRWICLSIGFAVMKDALDIDSEFQTFHKFCLNNKIPFNVISAGLKPVLRRVLDHFLGEEASSNIEIVANDATISSDSFNWKPVWLHDTEAGSR